MAWTVATSAQDKWIRLYRGFNRIMTFPIASVARGLLPGATLRSFMSFLVTNTTPRLNLGWLTGCFVIIKYILSTCLHRSSIRETFGSLWAVNLNLIAVVHNSSVHHFQNIRYILAWSNYNQLLPCIGQTAIKSGTISEHLVGVQTTLARWNLRVNVTYWLW